MKKILFLLLSLSFVISVNAQKKCNICNGYGVLICGYCRGNGSTLNTYWDFISETYKTQRIPCGNCYGYGKVKCPDCGGSGRIVKRKQISFGSSEASKYEGRKCSYVNSNGKYCNCSGCRCGNWDAFTCSNCGHKSNLHTR